MKTIIENLQADLYLMSIARRMRNGDTVHVGAAQQEIWLATEVAKLLWAPTLRVIAAGTCHLGRGSESISQIPTTRTYGRDVVANRHVNFHQSYVFNDLIRNRVLFPGAMQIDAAGNGNLIGFSSGPKYVRGPGSAGLPTLTSHSDRFFFTVLRHSKNVFVPKVDKITVLGDPQAREKMGLPKYSLQEVITPLCTFTPGKTGLELLATTPGVTVETVTANTGFDVRLASEFSERARLSAEERAALNHVRGQLSNKETS